MQIVNHCSFSEIYNKSSVSHFPLPCIFDIPSFGTARPKNPIKPTRVGLF